LTVDPVRDANGATAVLGDQQYLAGTAAGQGEGDALAGVDPQALGAGDFLATLQHSAVDRDAAQAIGVDQGVGAPVRREYIGVGPGSAKQHVAARAAVQQVIASTSDQIVVACPRTQHVRQGTTDGGIVHIQAALPVHRASATLQMPASGPQQAS